MGVFPLLSPLSASALPPRPQPLALNQALELPPYGVRSL
jgi:hypothetical protein